MFYLLLVLNIFSHLCWAQQPVVSPGMDMFTRGEAYYVNNDLFESEKIFRNIAKGPYNDDTKLNAMSRLVDIAEAVGDEKLFAEILENFRNTKNVNSDAYNSLLYSIGKYLSHDNDCSTAIKFLNRVDAKTPYYSKSTYIKASCYSLNKKYKEALLYFDRLSKSSDPYLTREIKDLAILGKARIFSVLGRFNDSIIAYQSIDSVSPYYLSSLYETGMMFISKKDYNNGLSHLEAISLLNYNDNITEFSLMKVKTIRGYIYMEQRRFEDANNIFEEVGMEYMNVKKMFLDELNRLKMSDDLTKIISHPYEDGAPRDLETNLDYALFNNDQPYAIALRNWLNTKEKNELRRSLNTYFSLNTRIESTLASKPKDRLTDDEIRLIAIRNLMNRYIKSYMGMLIKTINNRLDDIGLKAQLGKMDITWKIKEDQSKKIKEIQENKQQLIEDIDLKYKGY